MIGKSTIQLSFDIDNILKIKHNFWIASPNGCKQNILGMDIISQIVSTVNMEKEFLITKQEQMQLPLKKDPDKRSPYFTELESVYIYNDTKLPQRTLTTIKVKSEESNNYSIGATFLPTKRVQETELIFFETVTTKEEKSFPIMIENQTDKDIMLKRGLIGYIRMKNQENSTQKLYRTNDIDFVLNLISERRRTKSSTR
jgi:hypothetical protein